MNLFDSCDGGPRPCSEMSLSDLALLYLVLYYANDNCLLICCAVLKIIKILK